MVVTIKVGDALEQLRTLPVGIAQVAVCSPPYLALRSYLPDGHPDKAKEIGAEPTPDAFVAALVAVFAELARVLRPDGLLFVNLGDSMSGSGKGPTGKTGLGDQGRRQGFVNQKQTGVIPAKNCLLVPERFAIAMQDAGWIVRSRMPWVKANCMPESVRDRPVSAIEWVFMFAKQQRVYWDAEAVRRENTALSLARHGKGPEAPVNDARKTNVAAVSGGRLHQGRLNQNGVYTQGRSFRNSDLFWSHVEAIKAGNGLLLDEDGDPMALLVNPKPSGLEHFAAYPDTLVEPLIRAATSEKGQCPACGAPWRRVVVRERYEPPVVDVGVRAVDASRGDKTRKLDGKSAAWRDAAASAKTTGWEPGCACDAGDPVPQVALDPFAGGGTTGLVADRLGRDAVLIELNPQYAVMIERRLRGDAPMFADVEVAS